MVVDISTVTSNKIDLSSFAAATKSAVDAIQGGTSVVTSSRAVLSTLNHISKTGRVLAFASQWLSQNQYTSSIGISVNGADRGKTQHNVNAGSMVSVLVVADVPIDTSVPIQLTLDSQSGSTATANAYCGGTFTVVDIPAKGTVSSIQP